MNIFKRIAVLEERMKSLEERVRKLEFQSKACSSVYGEIDFREYVSRTSRDISKISKLEERIEALEAKPKKKSFWDK